MDALVVILTAAITLALALARTGRNAASQNTAVVTRALDVLIVLGLAAICSGVALVHTSMIATAAVMVLWIMTVLTSLALNRHLDRYEHTARMTAQITARVTARDTVNFDERSRDYSVT